MPASSDVEVANMALRVLGAEAITSFDEDSKLAAAMAEIYDSERDAFMREHEWNFAVHRTSLARLTAAPAFGPVSAFQLPPDYLRVLQVEPEVAWAIEGRTIVCDSDTLAIRYIRRVESPTLWDATFKKAFAARLAKELCGAVTELAGFIDRAERAYERAMGIGRTVDSQEKSVESALGSGANVLVDVRRTGAWHDSPWNDKWA